ncbi:hypothetical protein JKP88DRAFT_313826 [Tribonema minus]|uniref:Protein ENHANCED DISEASE RESISTANCE 2 C-terminal domain-containing protein n=1 Tax=Tribonema minus TaxID=303371 RepID=A0A835Z0S6_9STRA|nr:hypothetical protein JKP88DRAFT_313826 [Tribonema minus]
MSAAADPDDPPNQSIDFSASVSCLIEDNSQALEQLALEEDEPEDEQLAARDADAAAGGSEEGSAAAAAGAPITAGATVPRADVDGHPAAATHGAQQRPPLHSWSPLRAGVFLVRHGPNYRKRGLKAASEAALYDMVGCDLFTSAHAKVDGIADRVALPAPPHASPHPLLSCHARPLHAPLPLPPPRRRAQVLSLLVVPSLLVVNIQLPLEHPTVFSPALDGPTLHCVFYFALSAEAARALAVAASAAQSAAAAAAPHVRARRRAYHAQRLPRDNGSSGGGSGGAAETAHLSPALRLLCEFCAAAEADAEMRGRFKAIGVVNNVEEAGIPSLIAQYNGKPVLVTKSGTLRRVSGGGGGSSGNSGGNSGGSGGGNGGGGSSGGSVGGGSSGGSGGSGGGSGSSSGGVGGSGGSSGGSGGSSGGSGGSAAPHLEMDCNVRHWCYLARKGLHHLLPRFARTSLRVAFVLEGRADAELPERVLACAQLEGMDPRRARAIA